MNEADACECCGAPLEPDECECEVVPYDGPPEAETGYAPGAVCLVHRRTVR